MKLDLMSFQLQIGKFPLCKLDFSVVTLPEKEKVMQIQ
jgi:hypothetical protein